MGLSVAFDQPWYETTAVSPTPSAVPQVYSISIGGRTYVVNTSFEPYRRDAFRHRSIQAQREAIDLTNIPGQGTINTAGLWRREAIDWHMGAGQPFQDRKGSDEARFSTSKGVNPWMQWQLSLLNDTEQLVAAAGITQVLQVGKYIYVLDLTAQTLRFTADALSWTTVTGLPGASNQMMATDGFDLWIANSQAGGPGIYSTTAGATSAASYSTGITCNGVYWVGERLMATSGNSVFNITASGAAPAPLWSHPSADFVFSSMSAGSSQIYMAGYNVGQGLPLSSTVYRSTIEPTGTALTVPVQALPVEDGEYVTCVYGYLNFLFIGTNKGIRMCRTLAAYDPSGNQGDLEAGPLIPGLFPPGPVSLPVQAIVGNGRFIYFGWSNYDNVSTGIGRLDLSTFIDTQAPAFTSDLMVTGQGRITNLVWCSINNAPMISVAGKGVYTQSPTLVPSGYVDSGYISYGIADDKIVMAGDIGTLQPQSGPVSMMLSNNGSTPGLVGTQQDSDDGGSSNQSAFAINQIRGETFTVRMVLTKDTVDGISPILHRWTLKALPAITAGTTISVVLLLYGTDNNRGADTYVNAYAELAYLEGLRTSQTVVQYIEGPYSALVTVDEVDWLPFSEADADPNGGFRGDLIVYLKTWDIGA